MDIVTIDFETFYDKDFSLSKMTTEAYVRDPRFEVIGVGIKVNNHPADWYSGDSPGRFLKSLSYKDKAILCHNTAFDGAILSWHFGIQPKLWLDTLSMARPLHNVSVGGSLKALTAHYSLGEKGDEVINALGKRRKDFSPEELNRYAAYCVNDVDLTYKLFHKMKGRFTPDELRVIDITLRMYTEPTIELDQPMLQTHLDEVIDRKTNLVAELGLDCSEEEAKSMLMSNEKFATFLYAYGINPPMKVSAKTGKSTYAFSKTDKAFTALLEHDNPRVQNAVAARLGIKSTIEQSRTQSLIGVSERGPLPIMLNYYGAHTGRFSGGDKMNLQNLPRGGALRKSLCAPKGKVLISCDSSQIEARMVAWVSEQNDLLQAFREGRDVYSEFASEVYGKKVTKADKVERFVGKTCIAEGTLILTDRGEVPIEEIKVADRVWDGVEWVNHNGVVYQGEKEVIYYDGLYATADHGVFTEQGPLPFGVAASRLAKLLISGDAGQTIRVSEDYLPADTTPEEAHLLVCSVYDMWVAEMGQRGQPKVGQVQGLSALFPDQIKTFRRSWASIRCHIGSLLRSTASTISRVRWSRYSPVLPVAHGLYPLGGGESSAFGLQGRGDRSYRQQWSLCSGEFKACYSAAADQQQAQYGQGYVAREANTPLGVPIPICSVMDIQASSKTRTYRGASVGKVRVYDILNAGPRRRYTAAGKLVFNCILGLGYGMGAIKFRDTLALGQGGIKVEIEASDAQRIVGLYRNKNHRIAGFWNRCGRVLDDLVGQRTGQVMPMQSLLPYGDNSITLPNGLPITYPLLRMSGDGGGYLYISDGRSYRKAVVNKLTGDDSDGLPWVRIYGGKVTENIVQALARIVVSTQMVAIAKRYKIVLQVHDEIVCCVDEAEAEEAKAFIMQCMSTPPVWAPDLPVACEADIGKNYGEAH